MPKKKNNSSNKSNSQRTNIQSHHRKGKTLTPPFEQMFQQLPLKKVSWMNDRLPEYVWVSVLFSMFPREEAIKIIKDITNSLVHKQELELSDLSITALSKIDEVNLTTLLVQLCGEEWSLGEVFKPLLLFDNIPIRSSLEKAIDLSEEGFEWHKLSKAVANSLSHNSVIATDVRWARVYYMVCTGKLRVPGHYMQLLNEYPKNEELSQSIFRSTEGTLSMMDEVLEKSDWSSDFWSECLQKTACFPLEKKAESVPEIGKNIIEPIIDQVQQHFHSILKSTAIDAKLDAVFGISLYCLRIADEIIHSHRPSNITNRIALRSIVECYITLAYLHKKKDEDLWKQYRNYGYGQAKLASLKLDELEEKPKYVDAKSLEELANEDQWEEFVQIQLGHWENTNLRKMSEDAGIKAIYNSYYDWTSGFSHGQWAAVRDSVFDTCGNPLHRLHRIPKKNETGLNQVVDDTFILCEKVLALVNKIYPGLKYSKFK